MILEDELFQKAIQEYIAPRLPVIGLENPSFDYRQSRLPKLSLAANAWRAVVADLLKAAEVILVYFNEPSEGVSEELKMIRDAERQDATIIVVSSRAGETGDIQDFPNTINWDNSAPDPANLLAAMDAIPAQDSRKHFTTGAPEPRQPSAPITIKREADIVIDAGLVLAGKEFREGNLVEMEDRLSVCVAMAYWADIPEARTVAFLWIARGKFRLQQVDLAADNLGRALDIAERLVALGRYASSLGKVFEEAVQTFTTHNGSARIEALVERIRQLINNCKGVIGA